MKRSALRRKKPLRARKGLPKVNRARKTRLSEEQYGTKEFREWIHAQPCVVRGAEFDGRALRWAVQPHRHKCWGAIEAAHVKSRGAGGVASNQVPMCRNAHEVFHWIGRKSFQLAYSVDLTQKASECWADFNGRAR